MAQVIKHKTQYIAKQQLSTPVKLARNLLLVTSCICSKQYQNGGKHQRKGRES